MRRPIGVLTAAALFCVMVPCWASADEELGQKRVYLLNGRHVEGEVVRLDDGSYKITNKFGMVIRVQRNQVKAVTDVETGSDTDRGGTRSGRSPWSGQVVRYPISDSKIEAILAGIELDLPEEELVEIEDLDAPLPVNEEAVNEMLRQAGLQRDPDVPLEEHDNVLLRPHFVLVYTARKESAIELAGRMEAIWKWNTTFIGRTGVVPNRPEHKMEVYYFGSFDEFQKYTYNQGFEVSAGTLGYYYHPVNRSHFFDMWNWPILEGAKQRMKDKRTPIQERRKIRNMLERYVEHNNLEVIQHEVGHHLHFNTGVFTKRGEYGGLAPTWLVEGTTMMFEVPPSTIGKGGSSMGDLNDPRLDEFRRLYPRWTPYALKQFVINNSIWYQGYNYPRGWALVYYLYRKHHEGFGKFVNLIHEREEAGEGWSMTQQEADFEDCFGKLDEEWVDKMYAYLDSLNIRPSRLPPELR
jgi:hypothetical protein